MKIKNGANAIEHLTVPFEVKSVSEIKQEDGDFFVFKGYGSTFGNLDLHNDVVMPGAFTESLTKETPVILWQHDRFEPIGMPISIKEDSMGLLLEVRMPKEDTFVSGRVMPQLRIGSVKSMSIGFQTVKSEMNEETGVRSITQVNLKEVSLVTFPANPMAAVTDVKKLDVEDVEEIKTIRQFEDALRDSGAFSKKAATVLLSRFVEQGEPVQTEAEVLAGKMAERLATSDVEDKAQSILNKMQG